MTGNIAVFVTDQRQKNLAEYLPGKKVLLDWHNSDAGFKTEPVSKIGRYVKIRID